jgi:hypothetical protein
MNQDRLSRLGPLCGVLFTVLSFGGFAVSAGSTPTLTLSDSSAKIVKGYADPVGTGAWVGSYMTFLSLAAFAVFATWLYRSRKGELRGAGLAAVAAYVGVILVNVAATCVLNYRAGHGMDAQQTLTLFYLQEFLYIASWGLSAAVLATAPVGGWLRRTALVLAALILVAMAVPKAGMAQFPPSLFYIWVLVAGAGAALSAYREDRRQVARRGEPGRAGIA